MLERKRRFKMVSLLMVSCMLFSGLGMLQPSSAAADAATTTSPLENDDLDWSNMILSYGSPAVTSGEGAAAGTPLGNGYFGAKQLGGVNQDIFQLSDKGFWSGDPAYLASLQQGGGGGYGSTPAQRLTAYQNVRSLLTQAYAEGIAAQTRLDKLNQAELEARKMWEASFHSTHLPLGKMKLQFPDLQDNAVTNYKRDLDIDGATSNVSFVKNGTTYTRQAFTSYPDQVMVVKMSNSQNLPMNMNVSMELHSQMVGKIADNQVSVDAARNEVVMKGRAPVYSLTNGSQLWTATRGTTFESRVKVIPTGGMITTSGSTLSVTGASEITLIYSSETSFKDMFTDPANSGVDVAGHVRTAIDNAASKTYNTLLERHQEDYRSLYRKLWINLEGDPITAKNGATITPYQYARHYQYSRYLMISVERENTDPIPNNLLGMWNYSWAPPNESAFFLNENIQKFHALLGPANIAETGEPLWEWTKDLSVKGTETASGSYGIPNAWVVAHSTDVWGKTDLYGSSTDWANWTSGGLWLMNDMYNLYEFNQDIEYLNEMYPVMEGAARFALGNLTQVDGVHGELKNYLSIAPSASAEHWYTNNGTRISGVDINTAGDIQIYTNLFNIIEKASKQLQRAGYTVDTSLVNQVQQAKSKLVPLEMYIDENGRLKEWYNEYQTGQANHRHATHLLGLFLGSLDINERDNATIFQAEKKELQRLVGLGGGYHPDDITMSIHAGIPSDGYSKTLHGIIGSNYNNNDAMYWGPIAGASIAETMLDSRFNELNILPALPTQWKSGQMIGLRGRGGYELNISWANGELVKADIYSSTGQTPFVRYKGQPIQLGQDERFVLNRATTTLDKLLTEAQDKLTGAYTVASKEVLQDAIATNNDNTIQQALLQLVPIELGATINLSTANGQTTLTQVNQTLQLNATSNIPDASYVWKVSGIYGSPTNAATISPNGLLTAKDQGTVLVTASLKDVPAISKNLIINMNINMDEQYKENIDDRNSSIVYTGSWQTWDEAKHMNGTITNTTIASIGNTAELTFTGTGIEFISSKAADMGDIQVEIDGVIVANRISLRVANGVYQQSVFKKMDLTNSQHTIKITTIANGVDNKNRLDVDAFNMFRPITKQIIDDRDERLTYTGPWQLWDESKHMNGTIKYAAVNNTADFSVQLSFEGTGIEFVSSRGSDMGAVSVEIDGQVVNPNVSLRGSGVWPFYAFKKMDLTNGAHTIKITKVKPGADANNGVQVDAFVVYAPEA